ncbi:reverse transcriptase-like protein [Oerskovia sp. M15]
MGTRDLRVRRSRARRRDGDVLAERARYIGVASNNVAEYSGLVAGLEAVREIDPEGRVLVRMDSRLVVEQMSGRWKIKHEDMRRSPPSPRRCCPVPGDVRVGAPRGELGGGRAGQRGDGHGRGDRARLPGRR